jgi:predicted PurR-regulated permease PerM
MNAKELSNGLLRTIFILLGVSALFYLLYALFSLIIYIVIAIVIALMANPIVKFLNQRLKFKNTIAVITTLVLFLLMIVGFVFLFVPLILKQGDNLSLLDISSLEANYNRLMENLTLFLSSYNIDLQSILNPSQYTSSFNFNFVSKIFNNIIGVLGNLGMGLFSVLFITFFLLSEKHTIFNGFKFVLPDDQEAKVLTSIQKIRDLLSRYFLGLLLQLFIILVLYLVVFLIFGVENSFIIALLCAILNIIPYIGPLLGMLVASVLIMLSGMQMDFVSETLPKTLYVLIGLIIVQLIDNNVNQPLIFSKSTKSHPLEIFLVILAAGILLGITGMIIAVPVYTSLKVIGKEFLPENRIIKALTKKM